MKKILVFLIITLTLSVCNIQAQTKKKTQKSKITTEWRVSEDIDEYTQLPKKQLEYYDTNRSNEFFKYCSSVTFLLETNKLAIYNYFEGLPYFDLSWDALMNNGGKFPTQEIDGISVRFIKGGINYEEYTCFGILAYTSINTPGQDFVGLLIIEVDPILMKESKSVSVKWYDNLVEKDFTYNINLSGFTRVYNEIQK